MTGVLARRALSGGEVVELVPLGGGDVYALAADVRAALVEPAGARIRNGAVEVSLDQAASLQDSDALNVRWPADVLQFLANRRRPFVDDVARANRLKQLPLDQVRAQVNDCRLIDLLDDHQVRNVAIMTMSDSYGACVFDEQGTGKTISLVAAFDLLVEREIAEVLLIVAPKSMIGEWASEIDRFTDGAYRVQVLEGSRRAKAAMLTSGADVYVCNYETTLAISDDLRLLCTRRRVAIAADESFNVKNPSAARTFAATQLREWCVRAFALCGTPAPNSAADIVAQVSFVDMGRAFNGVALSRDPDDAQDQIRSIVESSVVFTRNLKQMVLPDLPDRTYTELAVTLSAEQNRLYQRVASQLATDLSTTSDDEFNANYANFLARRSALLRICSDPRGVDPSFSSLPSKFAALDELLARWLSLGEKVVIWSFYRSTLNQLAERYEKHGLVRIDGSVTDSKARRAAVKAFQTDDNTRLFLGNPAAAGAGITLHSAAISVYESMSNQAAHFLQSLDRTHRRGQTKPVEYVTLLSEGTIEWNEFERLKQKAMRQADLLGDPELERFSREMMLAELLASLDEIGASDAK
ncbi:SNF2 family DNA or RNA helicase [Salinibacterium sp. CAN_S4]|uniref:DEAD/DEAH box helicase n=1 Tax=Salinibacterium sp. CAN_S4 TaxID=2787727 RepID=UPI0018F00741